MKKSAKIYVAGHKGMVGSAIVRELKRQGYTNIVVRTHKELDLCIQEQVENFFEAEKPEYVFLAAGRVGGIADNRKYPVENMLDNVRITSNVMEAAHKFGCENLIFIASTCIYPKDAPLPLKEEYLMQGELDKDWEGYGLAKILGVKLCEFYAKEYGVRYQTVSPCNLYGIGDCYVPEKSRVVASLIKRFHDAKINHEENVEIWGTGKPLREFIFADDFANACIFLMDKQKEDILINVGPAKEYSIAELATIIKEVVGYEGKLVFNPDKPDGLYRKNLDTSKIRALGWEPQTDVRTGLKYAYEDYKEKVENV